MTFKFNFNNCEINDKQINDDIQHTTTAQEVLKEAVARKHTSSTVKNFESQRFVNIKSCDIQILNMKDHLKNGLTSNSDLMPGEYEGGLKVWEGAHDLITCLSSLSLSGLRVLEVGCGSGLPGIFCLKRGAKQVDFQDYNDFVIEEFTRPNVVQNMSESNSSCDINFYSGDWSNLTRNILPSNHYDLILTSETIYNMANHTKLLDLFHHCLKLSSSSSFVLVGAKICYFGVGGSILDFENRCNDKNKMWNLETIHSCDEGVKRKVLKLTRKL